MDEIVFEYRNKNYGAFILRKYYNKHLTISLLLAIFILSAGLCYPFISGFYTKNDGRSIKNDEGAVLDNPPPIDNVIPPPVPPAAPDVEKFIFRVPVVTEGEIDDNVDFNQDDLNTNTVNAPLYQEEPTTNSEVPAVLDVVTADEIHTFVEEMPTFVGGDAARSKFLAENIKYPQMAKESNVQGTVYVSFVIDSRGHITNVKLLRGIGGGCDEEALKVIGMMPNWNAGRQNGRTVSVSFNMPIVFKLAN
jgi:periplasmic protein TonB